MKLSNCHWYVIGLIEVLILGACGGGGGNSGPVASTPVFVQTVEFGPALHSNFRGYDIAKVAWPSENVTLHGDLWLPNVDGQYPAVMLHFGSNAWRRNDIRFGLIEPWLEKGIAVLVYDKRGVGESGGECCPFSDPGYFPLLATDLIEGVSALQMYPDIDSQRIGLYGFSQGGWIVPNATARSSAVVFSVIGSGPTVSLDEELLYSSLTGSNDCRESGLSDAEIDAQMAAASPGRFDPRSDLEMYNVPGFWFYGGRDKSVPVRQSINILEDIKSTLGKDFTYVQFPSANHSMVLSGAICQSSGPDADFFTPLFEWLEPILFG